MTFRHRAGVSPYTSSFDFAEKQYVTAAGGLVQRIATGFGWCSRRRSAIGIRRSSRELRDAAAGANITVIDQVYSPDEVLSLMDACDAYVSLHRSEGLGLTMAEAMLMGKPVIATNFSGNVDFMDDSNSLLVRHELVKLGKPIPPYDADLEWAEPSVEHAAQLMRRVYEDQEWARGRGARQGERRNQPVAGGRGEKNRRPPRRNQGIATECGVRGQAVWDSARCLKRARSDAI